MPAVSEAQRRAMLAAAEGRSTLGIPKAVGEEFVGKDASGHAAGILFVAPDGDVLLLRRSSTEANYAGHWSLPGGKAEDDESPEACAAREAEEEMGTIPEGVRKLFDSRMTPTGMAFHTYAQPVDDKFAPTLNDEHTGWCWAPLDMLPQPVHPGVAATLGERLGIGSDMSAEQWVELREGFAKWTREEEAEAEHAEDSMALDYASVRSTDQDGHLRVEITPISKANVCPYYGREIPSWQALGLDADRIYQLYRDPTELAKAADSFAGKPLLLIHTPVSADGHPREVTVGAIGDDVVFEAPYLKAPLTIWDGEAIDLINTGQQRELSSSYRYRADMTRGQTPEGVPFDGIMRDIKANHVALVERGRAGPDVLVNDEMPPLAATEPNSGIPATGIKRASARDEAKGTDMATKANDRRARDEGLEKLKEGLKEKMSAEDWKAACDDIDGMMSAQDEDDDEKKASDETEQEKKDNESEAMRIKEREEREKAEDEEEEKVGKKAMDEALRSAIAGERSAQKAIREAERFVRPWVGDLNVAFDSADEVYKAAIEAQGRSVKDVHPSAYRTILEMLPKPGQRRETPRVAMDAGKSNGFAERFPDAGRIRINA